MMELLLASMLTCAEGYWILDGIESARMEQSIKSEMKLSVLEAMPEYCDRNDHEPRPRNRKTLDT